MTNLAKSIKARYMQIVDTIIHFLKMVMLEIICKDIAENIFKKQRRI